jgi:hypothetical protein
LNERRGGIAGPDPEVIPVGYIQLLESVQVHGYHLMLEAQSALPRADIADDWYARVYLPTVEVIHTERLDSAARAVARMRRRGGDERSRAEATDVALTGRASRAAW